MAKFILENWEQLLYMAITILGPTGILGYVATLVRNKINSSVHNDKALIAFQIIDGIVANTVASASQTYVDMFKKLNADGKLTAEQKTMIKNTVIESVKKQIADDAKNAVSNHVGDLNEYISHKIEEVIVSNK